MTGFTNPHSMKGKDASMPTPQGTELVAFRTTISLLAADLVQNYIDSVAILPAGCVPVDIEYDITDPDASTAALVLSLSIGNLKDYNATVAAAGTAADTLASTRSIDGGGVLGVTTATTAAATARITKTGVNMANVVAQDYDRHIVAVVTTAPTTAAACTLGITLFYRNKSA